MTKIEGINSVKSTLSGLKKTGKEANPSTRVGYTAPYAVYVHENVEMKLQGQPRPSGLGVYWGPSGAGPKYLENPARELNNDGTLSNIIQGVYETTKSLRLGLNAAGLRVQRVSQLRVPREYSNLVSTAFTEEE